MEYQNTLSSLLRSNGFEVDGMLLLQRRVLFISLQISIICGIFKVPVQHYEVHNHKKWFIFLQSLFKGCFERENVDRSNQTTLQFMKEALGLVFNSVKVSQIVHMTLFTQESNDNSIKCFSALSLSITNLFKSILNTATIGAAINIEQTPFTGFNAHGRDFNRWHRNEMVRCFWKCRPPESFRLAEPVLVHQPRLQVHLKYIADQRPGGQHSAHFTWITLISRTSGA